MTLYLVVKTVRTAKTPPTGTASRPDTPLVKTVITAKTPLAGVCSNRILMDKTAKRAKTLRTAARRSCNPMDKTATSAKTPIGGDVPPLTVRR